MEITYELQSWNYSGDLVDQDQGYTLKAAKDDAEYLLKHNQTIATVVIYDDNLREVARFNRE